MDETPPIEELIQERLRLSAQASHIMNRLHAMSASMLEHVSHVETQQRQSQANSQDKNSR